MAYYAQRGSVRDPETWPPGSPMTFEDAVHRGLGIVIANDGQFITVLWDAASALPLAVYPIMWLNPNVISRTW